MLEIRAEGLLHISFLCPVLWHIFQQIYRAPVRIHTIVTVQKTKPQEPNAKTATTLEYRDT